jgi:hypothetical protein
VGETHWTFELGYSVTSDGGVMVLAQAEGRLAIAEKLAAVIADPR